MRGWCFAADPILATQGIRLRAGGLLFAGVIGLPRPDVRKAITSAPGDNVGFEIRGVLPPGRIGIILEAQLTDGTWQLLETRTLQVARTWRPLWLGGGSWADLMAAQMATSAKHPPIELGAEKFPPAEKVAHKRPAFSIVTPSFQQAGYLKETLRSVIDQTQVNGEYVVQDGGSTDGSDAVIRGLVARSSDSTLKPGIRITRWESIQDNGQADAIARGFSKTSGKPNDIMAWINSDDFYLPGALAFVADYFAAHPEVDAVYGHRLLVDENSREIGRWFLPRHDNEVLRLNDFVPQETLFWRRRLWDEVGGIDPSFKFAMDWDLLLRFQAAEARIVRLPYFLACFRIHPSQKTSSAMHVTGQGEIDRLRARTFGRPFSPRELEKNPRALRYLRRSARIEFLWKLGIRAA